MSKSDSKGNNSCEINAQHKMHGDIFYSSDGEDYKHAEIDDAIEEAFELMGDGDEAVIYKASAMLKKGSAFFNPDLFEILRKEAYNESGEFSEGWLDDTTSDKEKELLKLLKGTIDKFLQESNLEPYFFTVSGVEEIKIQCIEYPDLTEKGYVILK